MTARTILTFTLLFSFILTTKAQNLWLDWAVSSQGSDLNTAYTIEFDDLGNVFVTGVFHGTVDFDPGPNTQSRTAVGFKDCYVMKLDPLGNLLWVNTLGGTGLDESYGLAVDELGNVYHSGHFRGTVDFDPGPGTANMMADGILDAFIQKFDSNGNWLWARQMGDANAADIQRIVYDGAGHLYTTGWFDGTTDLDPGAGVQMAAAAGLHDAFVQKLDTAGNLIWVRTWGGADNDQGHDVEVDAAGNVYAVGDFRDSLDLNPGPVQQMVASADQFSDPFAVKLDANGNLLWAHALTGKGDDRCTQVVADNLGNVFLAGRFREDQDFDPGPNSSMDTSYGGEDAFVVKWDTAGNYSWTAQVGGLANDGAFGLALDAPGNVYLSGLFYGQTEFNSGAGSYILTAASFADIFLQKLDPAGNLIWAEAFGSSGHDAGTAIALGPSNEIYAAGNFSQSLDFDPGTGTSVLFAGGNQSNTFVVKYLQEPRVGRMDAEESKWKVYPNPNAGKCRIDLGETWDSGVFRIHDVTGKLIQESYFEASQWLDCQVNGPKGMYLLELSGSKGERLSAKIMVR